MTIPTKSRSLAFHDQQGRCYYCRCLMWLGDPEVFARQHGLRLSQVRHLRATAEHLIARRDGGTNARANIVAAHEVCNRRRHRPKKAMNPENFQRHVLARVAKRAWHDPGVLALQRQSNEGDMDQVFDAIGSARL